jgi:DNA N-6-adenine-methyltransferase (Dam)
MNTAVLFSSSTDRWETPQAVKTALYREFCLNFDPCPLDGTIDGLAPLFCQWYGKRVFCNPPYGSGIAKWIRRGFEADIAVYLLPARTDVRWFHTLCLPYAQQIRFLPGRLKFSGSPNGAPFPSMVVIFADTHRQGRLIVV